MKLFQRINFGHLALLIGAICLLAEMRSSQRSSARASEVEPPVLEYIGELHPERTVYSPGENVSFKVRWKIMLNGRAAIPILVFSSLVNEGDGTTYPILPVPHIIGEDGYTDGIGERRIVRFLPPGIEPGNYRLVGWAETHTDRIRQSARFKSEPFTVRVP